MHSVTGLAKLDLDAEPFERSLRIGRQISAKPASTRGPASISTIRAFRVSMVRKSAGNVARASSAIVPASSTPVGPAPTMTKVSSAARFSSSLSRSARSKASRMRPLMRRGVFECLQARRERAPIRRGQNRRAARRSPAPAYRSEGQPSSSSRPARGLSIAIDGGEQCRDIPALAQKMADWPSDLRRRKRGGRDLIEQRLEQVMIATVDNGDADRRAGEAINGLEPAKSGADHDHMMMARDFI